MGSEPPRKTFGRREWVTGLAALFFGFGIITFLMGSAVPWGTRQIIGLLAAILGIVLMFVRLWLPRSGG